MIFFSAMWIVPFDVDTANVVEFDAKLIEATSPPLGMSSRDSSLKSLPV
jgi:hypothetical protein